MTITRCPHCGNKENFNIDQIQYCTHCAEPFICIQVYCASKYHNECGCWNYLDTTSYLGKEESLQPACEMPVHLNANKPLKCDHCGYGWGLKQVVIDDKGEDVPLPFKGHFVVPLEEHTNLKVYHGTSPGRLESIYKHGLRPPESAREKSNGFHATEDKLRYTGRDLEPAQNHSKENCIIELTFEGYLAITSLMCVGEEINLLIDNLPIDISGVQYIEDGDSIAFRPQAQLTVCKMPKIPKQPRSWIEKIWTKLSGKV